MPLPHYSTRGRPSLSGRPPTTAKGDYRGRLYRAYVRTHTAGTDPRLARPVLLRQVCSYLPDRDARILDVGCGAGELVALLEERGFRRVRGIDVSHEQVELARARGVRNVERAELLDDLSAQVSALDAIVALDVLEHFDKPQLLDVVDAIVGALVPGGRLIARVPNAESLFGARTRYADFTHGTAFTQRSARQVLYACGFADVDIVAGEPVAHGPLSLLRLLTWKLLSSLARLYLIAETGQVRGHILTQNLVVVAATSKP